MGNRSSRRPSPPPRGAALASEHEAERVSLGSDGTVTCPRCHQRLLSPGQLFRCPCGQYVWNGGMELGRLCLQVLRLHPVSHARRRRRYRRGTRPGEGSDDVSNFFHAGPSPSARGMASMSALLEGRLRQLIRTLPEQDERARLLRGFLRRAPRESDGTIELGALLQILQALEGGRGLMAASRRTPQETLDLLPTFEFEPRSAPPVPAGEANEDEMHRLKCMICLTEYESGEMIRTLPCLHQFHRECIDQWLGEHDECPLCKTKVSDSAKESLSILEETFAAMASDPEPARDHSAQAGPAARGGAGNGWEMARESGRATEGGDGWAPHPSEEQGGIPDELWDMDPELQAALVASVQGHPSETPPEDASAADGAAAAMDSAAHEASDEWDPFGVASDRAPGQAPPGVQRRPGAD